MFQNRKAKWKDDIQYRANFWHGAVSQVSHS